MTRRNCLQRLEDEGIDIMCEAVAEAELPVTLRSIDHGAIAFTEREQRKEYF